MSPTPGYHHSIPVAALTADVRDRCESEQFPAFALGVRPGGSGGAAPAVFNAANEAAVALFLDGRIRFADIARGDRERTRMRSATARRYSRGNPRPPTPRRVDSCRSGFDASDPGSNSRLRPRDLRSRARAFHRRESSSGVYAPRFSIGFGPALFRSRRGETEYVLARFRSAATSAWPRDTTRRRRFSRAATRKRPRRPASDPGYDPNAMIPFGPKPVPENRWFESKPLWARHRHHDRRRRHERPPSDCRRYGAGVITMASTATRHDDRRGCGPGERGTTR